METRTYGNLSTDQRVRAEVPTESKGLVFVLVVRLSRDATSIVNFGLGSVVGSGGCVGVSWCIGVSVGVGAGVGARVSAGVGVVVIDAVDTGATVGIAVETVSCRGPSVGPSHSCTVLWRGARMDVDDA